MKLSNLIAIPFLVTSVSAAECYASYQLNQNAQMSDVWSARERFCDNPVVNSFIRIQESWGHIDIGHNGNDPWTHCWDAFENIINQCMQQHWQTGEWTYNGQKFWFTGTPLSK
ncbi:hypothetical protein PVAG01_04746 [Phlyctema vagabunda]|uniref:Secreted protein n=1 Tax=Phlyctema vagabunda TaxID=108571 RepID=A0ABR4PI84_9HELO